MGRGSGRGAARSGSERRGAARSGAERRGAERRGAERRGAERSGVERSSKIFTTIRFILISFFLRYRYRILRTDGLALPLALQLVRRCSVLLSGVDEDAAVRIGLRGVVRLDSPQLRERPGGYLRQSPPFRRALLHRSFPSRSFGRITVRNQRPLDIRPTAPSLLHCNAAAVR